MHTVVVRRLMQWRRVYVSAFCLFGVAFTIPATTYGQASYEIVTSFDVPEINGTNPQNNCTNPPTQLIEASDGMFYGAAEGGFGHGILFRLDASGTFTVLHRFT